MLLDLNMINNAVQYLKDEYSDDFDYLLNYPILNAEYSTIGDAVSAQSWLEVYLNLVGSYILEDGYKGTDRPDKLMGETLLAYLTCIVAIQILLKSLCSTQNKDPRFSSFKLQLACKRVDLRGKFSLPVECSDGKDHYLLFSLSPAQYDNKDDLLGLKVAVNLDYDMTGSKHIYRYYKVKDLNKKVINDFLITAGF